MAKKLNAIDFYYRGTWIVPAFADYVAQAERDAYACRITHNTGPLKNCVTFGRGSTPKAALSDAMRLAQNFNPR